MILLQVPYDECYEFVKRYFSKNTYASRNSLAIGYLGYIGFNISERWMKLKTNDDEKIRLRMRRVIGVFMKYLSENKYVSKHTNTTWKMESEFPDIQKDEALTCLCRGKSISF